MKTLNTAQEGKTPIAAWLTRSIISVAACSAVPLGIVMAACALGVFSDAFDYNLFATCVYLAVAAGGFLAYNMGLLKR